MNYLKITKIGNSMGVILSKEILTKLRIHKGDKLFVVETQQGVELTPCDPAFAKAMLITDRIIQENKNSELHEHIDFTGKKWDNAMVVLKTGT